MVPHTRLGQTDLMVSRLGLGTVKFGRNTGVKYPDPFLLPDDQTILNLLEYAKEVGINLLDTAPAYGNSEERLGQLLKKSDPWIICTKVGESFINGKSTFQFDSESIEKSILSSLKRLKREVLDIVLVHSDGRDVDLIQKEGVFDTLTRFKKKGLLRAFGISSKTVAGGILAVEQSDVAMVTYNPNALEEKGVIERAHQLSKGILIKKAFASGHLNTLPGQNPVKETLQFILKTPGVSSIVLGTVNQAHLEEAVNYIRL